MRFHGPGEGDKKDRRFGETGLGDGGIAAQVARCQAESTPGSCREFTCRGDGKQRQLGFRDGKFRKATIHAHQKLREYPDTGFVNIFEAGEMDDHFGRKFRLIT